MTNTKKFTSFLESLKNEENVELLESIEYGYKVCFESYRTFDSEFDTSKYTIPDYFTQSDEWEADMWHNNVCPGFRHTPTGIKVWIEADDPDERESPSSERFVITREDEDGDIDYDFEEWVSDSEEELFQYLSKTIGQK